jgi:hypothetical protein
MTQKDVGLPHGRSCLPYHTVVRDLSLHRQCRFHLPRSLRKVRILTRGIDECIPETNVLPH